MKKAFLGVATALVVLTSACATLTAPEETKQLKYAASVFSTALGNAQTADRDSLAAYQIEQLRNVAARGGEIRIVTTCRPAVEQWRSDFDGAAAIPADWRTMDAVYARRLSLVACDLPGHDILPSAHGPLAPSLADPDHALALETADLNAAAAHLNDYVDALADIANGESSAKVDAARGKVAVAARGLANVLSGDNAIAGPVIDLVNQAIGWITASRRNAATRNFLNEMDRAMPDLMERLGLAARLKMSQALVNRARAAQSAAQTGAPALNAGRRHGASAGVDMARVRTFDEVAARLEMHNQPFRELRASDPMIAARAFARSHRALRDVFNDPRSDRQGFQTALQDFLTNATALAAALQKTNHQ